MARDFTRHVGWFQRDEFLSIYNELFSGDGRLQKHAVDRISAWKSRVLHKLPVAIDCTAELVTGLLQHRLAERDGGVCYQQLELRLALCGALIRFVNLITEEKQVHSYTQPVHRLANELGLPNWLVDLRHDGSHSNLPSLHFLLLATKIALKWLEEHYWKGQVEHCPKKANSPEDEVSGEASSVNQLLEKLVSVQIQVKSDSKRTGEGVEILMREINKRLKSHENEVINILIGRNYLLPSHAQCSELGINSLALLSKHPPVLPDPWLRVWKVFMDDLSDSLKFHLIVELLGQLQEKQDRDNYIRAAWIRTLFSWTELKPVKAREVMSLILRTPSYYAESLLNKLFSVSDCGLSPEQHSRLLQCVHWFVQVTSDSHKDVGNAGANEETMETEDTLPQDILLAQAANNSKNGSSWTKYDGSTNWSMTPIGILPECDLTFTSLELPVEVNFIQTNTSSHLESELEEFIDHAISDEMENFYDDMSNVKQKTASCDSETDSDVQLESEEPNESMSSSLQ